MASDSRTALSYLNKVHATLSKDDGTTKSNRAIVDSVLRELLSQMKCKDPLFNKAFNRITYTGSSFEGLRIREADEFDINCIINLPIENVEFELTSNWPGFVSYSLTETGLESLRGREDGPVLQRVEKLFSTERKLLAQLFRTWFQSVTDMALGSCKFGSDSPLEVQPSQSGPAKTLYVTLDNGKRIDIDLVPVLEFSYNLLPKGFPRNKRIDEYCEEIDKKWVMVPKTPRDKGEGKDEAEVHAWRVHFPDIEKKLMEDCGCIKPVIRLLKALKDAYEWKLSSYALKTVVMRYRVEEKPHKLDWGNERQWTLLLEVLKKLIEELESKSGIRYLFNEKLNLVQDLKEVTKGNIVGCLKRVYSKLSQSPENILVVFKIAPAAPKLTSSPLPPGCKTPGTPASLSPSSGDVTPDEAHTGQVVKRDGKCARNLFNGIADASLDGELDGSHLSGGAVASDESLSDEASPNSSSSGVSEASAADEAGVKSNESLIEKATQKASDSTLEGPFADEFPEKVVSGSISGESGFIDVPQSCSEIAFLSCPADEPKVIIAQQLQFSDDSAIPNIEVTLSAAASDGQMLGEATCSTRSCRELGLKVPKSKLPSRAEAALLVVTLRFKSSGESPKFSALVSLMTSAGQQLAEASFRVQLRGGTCDECGLCISMPALE